MNNREIPETEINEAVARALGWISGYLDADATTPAWLIDKNKGVWIAADEASPLTNHSQFHELWTPDIEAKACDVLDEWLSTYKLDDFNDMWWDNTKYQSNRRLCQLRAYCEVMGNEE